MVDGAASERTCNKKEEPENVVTAETIQPLHIYSQVVFSSPHDGACLLLLVWAMGIAVLNKVVAEELSLYGQRVWWHVMYMPNLSVISSRERAGWPCLIVLISMLTLRGILNCSDLYGKNLVKV